MIIPVVTGEPGPGRPGRPDPPERPLPPRPRPRRIVRSAGSFRRGGPKCSGRPSRSRRSGRPDGAWRGAGRPGGADPGPGHPDRLRPGRDRLLPAPQPPRPRDGRAAAAAGRRPDRRDPRPPPALAALRDQGCQFPGGCDQPPAACPPRHVRHRADGGPASLANLKDYCWRHHHILLHQLGWTLTVHPDGTSTAQSPDGKTIHSHHPPTHHPPPTTRIADPTTPTTPRPRARSSTGDVSGLQDAVRRTAARSPGSPPPARSGRRPGRQ